MSINKYELNIINKIDKAKCYTKCEAQNKKCEEKSCRLWIDYPKDLNCTEIAVKKNDKLVLREVGERLKLTPSRIKQIQTEAMQKLMQKVSDITDVS